MCVEIPIHRGKIPAHFLLGLLLAACFSTAAHAAAPVVASLSADSLSVLPGSVVQIDVQAYDPDCSDTCTTGCGQTVRADLTGWSATGGIFLVENDGTTGSPYAANAIWEAPGVEDIYTITVSISDSGSFMCGGRSTTTADLQIQVTLNPTQPPVIDTLTASPDQLFPGESSTILCSATDPDGDPITLSWSTDLGVVLPVTGGEATFSSPNPGLAAVKCIATDSNGASGSETVRVAVTGAQAYQVLSGGLAAPQRVAVDSNGTVYVADPAAGGITAISLAGGGWLYRLSIPDVTSVAVDWNDYLLVGGSDGARVLDREGALIRHLTAPAGLGSVADVAVDVAAERYGVLYRNSSRIVLFDSSGNVTSAFGSVGDMPAQLKSPSGLALVSDGSVLVADRGQGEVKRFDAAGVLLASFGARGAGLGEFVELDAIAVSADGLVFVSDSFQSWVQIFRMDGTLWDVIGTYGEGLGEFRTPAGIAISETFGLLVVASANASNLQVFDLGGGAVSPPAGIGAVSPGSLSFGNQVVGSISSPRIVVLMNTGSSPLGIHESSISPGFEVTDACTSFLDPGQSCSFGVTFAPAAMGSWTGELVIRTSGAGADFVIPLSGSGFVAAELSLSASSLDFSNQAIGSTSASQVVEVRNLGTVSLGISAITAVAPFAQGNNCGSSLVGRGSCTVSVSFSPSVAGSAIGSLALATSAGSTVVSLAGFGVTQGALSLAPTAVTFPPQPVGTTSEARDVLLTNVGDGPLVVQGSGTTGPFSIVSSCPAVLDGGTTCPVAIRFAPQADGPATGSLTVTTDRGSESVSLVGEGDDGVSDIELGVEVQESDDPVFGGSGVELLEHVVRISNVGATRATGIRVSVLRSIPLGVSTTLAQPTGGTFDGTNWDLPALQSFGAAELKLRFEVSGNPLQGTDVIRTSVAILSADQNLLLDGDEEDVEKTSIADNTPPWVEGVVSGVDALEQCRAARKGVSRVGIAFNEPVANPPGDYLPGDVTNTDSYRFMSSGPDQDFDSDICGPARGDDRLVPFRIMDYDPVASVATLEVNQGEILPDSLYRLMVCGTISPIRDVVGNGLDGDRDGEEGGDHLLTFRVNRLNLFENGHFDCDLDGWTLVVTHPDDVFHSPIDVDGSSLSGSAEVFTHIAGEPIAMGQCVRVFPRVEYTLEGRVRSDSPNFENGMLRGICEFYSETSCAGEILGARAVYLDPILPDARNWYEWSSVLTSPPASRSGVCFLAVDAGEGFIDLRVDGLELFGEGELFADGFETGGALQWTSNTPRP